MCRTAQLWLYHLYRCRSRLIIVLSCDAHKPRTSTTLPKKSNVMWTIPSYIRSEFKGSGSWFCYFGPVIQKLLMIQCNIHILYLNWHKVYFRLGRGSRDIRSDIKQSRNSKITLIETFKTNEWSLMLQHFLRILELGLCRWGSVVLQVVWGCGLVSSSFWKNHV